jgi:hypothetical protein
VKEVEFRYRKRLKEWIIIPTCILVLVIIADFWITVLKLERPDQFVGNLVYFLSGLITMVLFYRYYRKVSQDAIIVDEQGITHKRKGDTTTINWETVVIVEWGTKKSTDGFSSITVRGTDKVIGIGSHIEGFDQIIQFTKQKVGDRFCTWDIPGN